MYHLYPNLVDYDEATDEYKVQLCSHRCAQRVRNPKYGECGKPIPPACSLSAGVDYGTLEKLGLPELSDIEKILLADVRMYAVVLKVVAESNKKHEDWQHAMLRGHTIFFVQSGTETAATFIERSIEQRVEDLLQKVFQQFDSHPNPNPDPDSDSDPGPDP